MLLKQQLSTSGAWLFRWRSYLPLVFAAVLIPSFSMFCYPFGSHSCDLVWEFCCLGVSLFGLVIRGYTVGYTPKGTSGRNTKKQRADLLNTTGMYSVTRNPLYLGNFFMMLGVSMFPGVWWVTVIYILMFWLYYERIIMAEEAFLLDKFGLAYEDYCRRTPVFIPNFRLWVPSDIPFSLRTVLKREYSGLFGVVAAFTVLEFLSDYCTTGRIVFDPVWVSVFFFGLSVYLVLRTLKKKTRILHVAGR